MILHPTSFLNCFIVTVAFVVAFLVGVEMLKKTVTAQCTFCAFVVSILLVVLIVFHSLWILES